MQVSTQTKKIYHLFFVLMPSFNYEVLKSELVISIKFAHVKKVARKSSLGALSKIDLFLIALPYAIV